MCSLENKEKNSAISIHLSLLKLLTVFNSLIVTGFMLLSANEKLGDTHGDSMNR